MKLINFFNTNENMDHSKDDQAVPQLKTALLARKEKLQSATDDQVYDIIDKIMTRIAKAHGISGQKLHDMWVDKYGQIPDTWIMKENFADGKGPGKPGDSQRHGIPKKATMAELEKASHASGRKGQLARWQLNMRRGKAKTNEGIDSTSFKEILKVFLPIAKKIIKLDKMPAIILRKHISEEDQPTMGRFHNDTYELEVAIANRQPVDVLRTLAHELVHAKQNRDHVDIDPSTGSPEENEANVLAGIVMRHFNKMHPEYLKAEPISEGGNLAVGDVQAQQIDLKVHDRKFIVPVLDQLLQAINNSFAKTYKKPLWNPQLLQSKKFLSGSSLHFFNTDISDDEFVKRKPKVGDIDTQVNKESEAELEQFLTSVQGKTLGTAKLIGFQRGNEQFSSLWELQNPPIKVQIDLEFVGFEKDEPSPWSQFSHSSSWDDLQQGIKGVFHKYMMRALTANSATEKYVARQLKKGVKISDQPVIDNNLSFAVSSKQGGGMRQKYKPYIDPETGQQKEINGIPVMLQVPAGESEYIQDLGQQYSLLFNRKPAPEDAKQMWSFVGLAQLANKFLQPQQRQAVAEAFVEMLFGPGSQGLYKGDPKRDQEEKMVALNTLVKGLQGINGQGVLAKAQADSKEYYAKYKVIDESLEEHIVKVKGGYELKSKHGNKNLGKYPTKAGAEKRERQVQYFKHAGESVNEADVKAQLRKGMPHLRDLKPVDFLDLIDELRDSGGQFKLQNIPLNVKIDGFGGRFGKNSEGKPFMGTSRTEPRYQAGFVDYHKQKGTTDPEILGRAQNFDKLFNEIMSAIKLIDSKLGPDFLVDKQVTCEVLFLPFATQTDEGKLKFVGIEYNQLPQNVDLVLVPYKIVQASTGEEIPNSDKIVQQIAKLGQGGNVMFMSNRLAQKEALDVTEIINVLDNIDELKQIVSDTAGKRDRASLSLRKQVEEKLKPVQIALEKAIDEDPNIVGKDNLGQDYEGIVINSRLGPIKVTSQRQKDIITAKNAAKQSARTERPRTGNKTAVVAVGSFVGHVGHEQLFDYTIKKAEAVGGDPYLFMGNAVGKDDPIPVQTKLETWHKLYPEYTNNISAVTQQGGTLMQKIKHELINPLPGKPPRYDNIIIMVGEDQAAMNIANALMKAVNKFQGYEHVKVSLEPTPRGTGMSFTKLRNILKDPNATPEQQYQVWAGGFDEKKLGKDWILHLMDVTRKGMGIQNTTAPKQKAGRVLNTLVAPKVPQQPTAESMLPTSAFAGSNKNKLGIAGQLRNQKRGARAGDLVGEAPIEMDPADPMDPMIYGHEKANPAKLKFRMARAAGQLKDLAARSSTAGPVEWQVMARQFEELKMNINQIQHALDELAKKRKKGGIASRGIDTNIDEEWSKKYKSSINCSNPKGFSQKAHCAGKKKNESIEDKCVPLGEGWELQISSLIKILESK